VERQYVGIDPHRRRSVIVRRTDAGETLSTVRIENDPVALSPEVAKAGPNPEVVLEATYGWYWAADVLHAEGATVHLAHRLGNNWGHRRVKNDERDATDRVDLLRVGRLAEAWIAPPAVRELRELVRYRAKLVALRSGLKAQVHAVLAKEGVAVPVLRVLSASRTLSMCRTGYTKTGCTSTPESTRLTAHTATPELVATPLATAAPVIGSARLRTVKTH
jgi:transposase